MSYTICSILVPEFLNLAYVDEPAHMQQDRFDLRKSKHTASIYFHDYLLAQRQYLTIKFRPIIYTLHYQISTICELYNRIVEDLKLTVWFTATPYGIEYTDDRESGKLDPVYTIQLPKPEETFERMAEVLL